jgi:hypothetical protein
MALSPKNGDLGAGIAGQWSETLNREADSIVAGDAPAMVATDMSIATGQDLAAYEAVGYDGSGNLIPAVEGVTAAIGIMAYPIVTTGVVTGHVYRIGCFNSDVIVWDASYDDAPKKASAFEGAPSPTQIVLRTIQTLAV